MSKATMWFVGCVIAAVLGAASVPAQASSAWVSAGAKDGDASVALGVRGPHWGLEVGFVRNYDFVQDEVFDFPIPHSDYRALGTKRIDPAWGFDVLRFFPLGTVASAYAGVGVYAQKKADVAESNVTGWRFEQSSSTRVDGAAQAGVHFALGRLVLGIGYHTLRGPNVSVGAQW